MTSKPAINLSPRTDKELAFFLQHNIISLSQGLWEWIALQGSIGTETEIDLKEFETFVDKHRGNKFARWWMKKKFQWLVDNRIIQIIKEFSSTSFRVILRPFDWLKPRKKNSQNHLQNLNLTCDLDPSNDQCADTRVNNNNILNPKISSSESEELKRILDIIKFCEQYGYQPHPAIYNLSIAELKYSLEHWSSQQYKELERRYDILKLCADYGIYYHPKKTGTQELFHYDISEIELGIKKFLSSGGFETNASGKRIIPNPQGWLIKCLRESWWEECNYGDFISILGQFLPKEMPRDYS